MHLIACANYPAGWCGIHAAGIPRSLVTLALIRLSSMRVYSVSLVMAGQSIPCYGAAIAGRIE
jgi:hypothetical protein